MIKKSKTYLIIVLINFGLLSFLFLLSTDQLEILLNEGHLSFGVVKIFLFSLIALVVMRIIVFIFNKATIYDRNKKIAAAVFSTLLVCVFLYKEYGINLIHRIRYNQPRQTAANKIKYTNQMAHGTESSSLTLDEYREVVRANHLPEISSQATDISYVFAYDGFLPDYYLSVSYHLPLNVAVDTFQFKKGDFSKSQYVSASDNLKTVNYTETEQ